LRNIERENITKSVGKLTDHELESIREKRKRELLSQSLKKDLAQKNQDDAVRKQQERVIRATMIVNQFLEIDAREYMEWLSRAKPAVAQTIKDTIILLAQKKMIPKPLSKIDIRKIERELTGEQSQIKVKRRGKEATGLDEVMKGKK